MDYNWLRFFYLISLIYLINCENVKPPEIIEHPVDTLVRKNEPATLNCKASGNPTPSIHWYVNGQKVKNTGHRMQLPSGALFFLQVQNNIGKNKEQDTGVYYCIAKNTLGKIKSRNATLSVAYIHKEFRVIPKSVQTISGDNVHLQCVPPKAQPEANVRWLKDGQLFIDANGLTPTFNQASFSQSSISHPSISFNSHSINDETIGLFPVSDAERIKLLSPGTLRILNVQPKDNGRYSCVAENFVDVRESPPALLNVLVKPFFTQKPKNVIVMINEPIDLACSAEAQPEPSISWSRKEKSDSSRFFVDKENTLRIEHAQLSDQGIYICEATNQAATITTSVQVTVHSPPQLINKPEDIEAQQGSSVRLHCSASGSPSPTLIWLRQLNNEAMRLLDDATNSLPNILQTMNSYSNHYQKTIFEQQAILFSGNVYDRIQVDDEGSLLLKSAKKDDEGLYVCCALNLLASTCSSSGLLILPIATPPLIYKGPLRQTLRENSIALIRCEISMGKPGSSVVPINSISGTLQLIWLLNGNKINLSSQKYLLLDSGTLQIQSVQKNDSGIYTCIVKNEIGEDSFSNQLNVLHNNEEFNDNLGTQLYEPEYLEMPNYIYLIKSTHNELTISWNPAKLKLSPLNPDLKIIGYQVSFFSASFIDKLDKNQAVKWKTLFTDQTNITISNLEPNSGYIFVIRCQTKYGLSTPSNLSEEFYTYISSKTLTPSISNAITDNDKLLDKVSKLREQLSFVQIHLLRAKPVNASTMRLLWQLNSLNALSTINGYIIYYRKQKSDFNTENNSKNFAQSFEQNYNYHLNNHLKSNQHHHAHHFNYHPSHKLPYHFVILNSSSSDSTLIYNLQPFTTYEFFILAYHSPYLFTMPSNIALGRTAEAVPIKSPSRIHVKVIENKLPSLNNQLLTNLDYENKGNSLINPSAVLSNSGEDFSLREKNKIFNEPYLNINDLNQLNLNSKNRRLAVEISWSHVPDIYWRGVQKAYKLDFQLIQNSQYPNNNNYLNRLNNNLNSFQVHVASNLASILQNPANHLQNNSITLTNLTIGASYLLKISACTSAGCGLTSASLPIKVMSKFSYTLVDDPKTSTIAENSKNLIDKHSTNSIKSESEILSENLFKLNNLNNFSVSSIDSLIPKKIDTEHNNLISTRTNSFSYLDHSVQTILLCSAAIFIFFLASFLILLATLFLCKNRKLNLKQKNINLNNFITNTKDNCEKKNEQSQQMRLLAPVVKKNITTNYWTDSLSITNTAGFSNTNNSHSRMRLPPIPTSTNNSSNNSQHQLPFTNTNKNDKNSCSTNSSGNYSGNSTIQDHNQACNGYAELEGHHQVLTFRNNENNFNNKLNSNNCLQTVNNPESTQPYATTTLMMFNKAFNTERELIQDGGSSDQSLKLSIGNNHLNNSLNSNFNPLQQHFQNNHLLKTNQNNVQNNFSDSGSEVYGVSRSSQKKISINGSENCSSIESLSSNSRFAQVRKLIEKEDSGYYHQPFENIQTQQNKTFNNSYHPLKPEILRITTNSQSSRSSNDSPQIRTRFNNFNRSTTSFTGYQTNDDNPMNVNRKFNINVRQKSECNLVPNNFSIVCNPLDNLEINSRVTNDSDTEYNTFDTSINSNFEFIEDKLNKKNFFETSKLINNNSSLNSKNSLKNNLINKSVMNNYQNGNTENTPETQSLIGIYDLVSEDGER